MLNYAPKQGERTQLECDYECDYVLLCTDGAVFMV